MRKAGWVVCALLVITVTVVGIVVGRVLWTEHNKAMVETGRREMREHYARELDLNARIKREMAQRISDGVEKGVNDYAARFRAEQAQRIAGDEMARDRVEALIMADPAYYTNRLCIVPDQMLAERNTIRQNNAGD